MLLCECTLRKDFCTQTSKTFYSGTLFERLCTRNLCQLCSCNVPVQLFVSFSLPRATKANAKPERVERAKISLHAQFFIKKIDKF